MYGKTIFGKLFFLVRALAATLWFFAASLFVLIIALFRPFNTKNGTLFAELFPGIGLWILGIKIELRGQDRLEKAQPCIYLGNHQHLIDLFTYGYALPPNAVTLGKKSIRVVPIFGWLYWLSGHIFIDRKNNERAVATMKEAADRMSREKLSLLMFPEGTRSRGKPIQPFKKGAFYLARETGFALLPVVASNYFPVLSLGKRQAGKVLMQALPAVHVPKDTDAATLDRLIEDTHRRMKEGIEKLDKELAQRTNAP